MPPSEGSEYRWSSARWVTGGGTCASSSGTVRHGPTISNGLGVYRLKPQFFLQRLKTRLVAQGVVDGVDADVVGVRLVVGVGVFQAGQGGGLVTQPDLNPGYAHPAVTFIGRVDFSQQLA